MSVVPTQLLHKLLMRLTCQEFFRVNHVKSVIYSVKIVFSDLFDLIYRKGLSASSIDLFLLPPVIQLTPFETLIVKRTQTQS